MKRLTKNDWKIINEALAVFEAEDAPSQLYGTDPKDDQKHYDAIVAVRRKVFERLQDD